ncbi:hypothetical protein HanHA300_Chr07g0241001 [Helianthus annuus]|nr:hypothetical protein HanHA300_Chr07g0241001 [Helianthus annuus]KAJ0563004.1 hypothetical protein HanHA89_Chr07g0258191 [Helianthus annuus]KAJ0728375.1 hypothetical protein HanLR1_Chr07g0240901 [Helianthus annuus]KAJ0731133.1 hypothetical protein HanOQP8_Chr07g0248481 [Helianthus annuus]
MILREWNAFWNGRFHSIDQPNTFFFIPSQWSIPFHLSLLHTKHYLILYHHSLFLSLFHLHLSHQPQTNMGSCCSKTDTTITSKPVLPEPQPEKKNNNNTAAAVVASPKDVFVVKQRKSHEVERHPDQETRKSVDQKKNPNSNPNVESSKSPVIGVGEGGVLTDVLTGGTATVRMSSCTKEEVDAILIQCGRLSRSSSGAKPETPTRAASPRARSPAKVNIRVLNENQNPQPVTLSRSNSKKAEHSPHRRNPLGEIDTNIVGSEQPGIKKPNGNQTVSKTRSSRLSRELDINPETLTNPTPNPPSYASLLLEDIQNFHQKNPPTAANDRQLKKDNVAESEKVVSDDLMEQSLLKYVTVRRGGGDADSEEQESSGSNSFAGSQQLSWMSSSWEPNSGDSSDCWTSKSRSDARDVEVERSEYPRNGIGRGRVGGLHGRSAYSLPNNATFASA